MRQFLSGLTNQRTDRWGADRLAMARAAIDAVRAHVGIVGLRLSCDELAPWAGITPQAAPALAAELALAGLDYVVVVRGSIFSADKTRADYHEPTAYNMDVARAVRAAVRQETAVVVQGAIVHADQAEAALTGDPAPDAVEMTRAQLADPDLVSKLAGGRAADIRPCTRCNQTCQVRDARNPIITCVGEPSTGHETDDPDWTASDDEPRDVLIIGGGPAGLEAGRVRGAPVATGSPSPSVPAGWAGWPPSPGRTPSWCVGWSAPRWLPAQPSPSPPPPGTTHPTAPWWCSAPARARAARTTA
ncbi:MAG: hypothetical protein V9E89_04820 [Ilumatobacteraceae bacterium]